MIASAQTLRKLKPVEPFVEKDVFNGLSYGLSSAGYDIRVDQNIMIYSPMLNKLYDIVGGFYLVSSLEEFTMPLNLLGIVHDKSTWARKGLFVQNTVIEPGWNGYLTLEITNQGPEHIYLEKGTPIAQIIFHLLDKPTDRPYKGKYQDQKRGPQEAITE